MDSIDGQRVMAVLHDLVESLSLSRLLTPPLLTSILDSNPLAPGARELLAYHQQVVERVAAAAEAGGPTDPVEVATSTRQVCKLLKREPLLVLDLQRAEGEVSEPLALLTAVVRRLGGVMKKRLSSSVEEEASLKAFYVEVARREEKWSKELTSLEQAARVERRERSKTLLHLAEQERRAKAEVEVVRSQTVTLAERLANEYKAAEEADQAQFDDREAALCNEVSALAATLARLQAEQREVEGTLRSKKKSSEKEVADWLMQYDVEMAARDKENRDNKAEYHEIKKKLKVYQTYYQRLQEQEEQQAAEEKRLAEAKARLELDQQRINYAAKKIQHAWRTFRNAKGAKETGSTKKGKGDKRQSTAKKTKGDSTNKTKSKSKSKTK